MKKTKSPEARLWRFTEVLRAELGLIRGWKELPPSSPDAALQAEPLRKLYAAIADKAKEPSGKLSAICLSGGGIRSATFNLGVLQALARADLLDRFDYLSTVSGGGYIGAWLQAWIAREREQEAKRSPKSGKPPAPEAQSEQKTNRSAENGKPPATTPSPEPSEVERQGAASITPLQSVMTQLCRPGRTPAEAKANQGIVDDPLAPEPKPIDRLREFSNYLTPRTGLLSGDTWTVVAIVLRNLVLNWIVIVPVIAAVLMIPQMALLVATSPSPDRPEHAMWAKVLAGTGLGFGFVASVITHSLRGERRSPRLTDDPVERAAVRRRLHKQKRLALASLVLLVLAATMLVLAGVWVKEPWQILPLFDTRASMFSVWAIGLPVAGMLSARFLRWARRRRDKPKEELPADSGWRSLLIELFAFISAGVIATLLLTWLTDGPWTRLRQHPPALVILALPIVLAVYAIARIFVTAFRSPFEDVGFEKPQGESEREWWARMTGRALLVAVVWVALSSLILFGSWLDTDANQVYQSIRGLVATFLAAVGAASGVAASLLGKSADTSSGHPGPATSWRKELALRLAAPLTVASVTVLLGLSTSWVGRLLSGDPCFLAVESTQRCQGIARTWTVPLFFLYIFLGLLVIGFVAGVFVNVNRFSLHALYRNRLVRAYLGASNIDRRPNPITGFDEDDGRLALAELVPGKDEPAKLFPIINVTLNLLGGERLAWQDRKAESFSMTPLFCGNFYEGYRETKQYGGSPNGISLATAMAISGAAANPNMGYASSPALTFLMALLNARLGVWLPNTNEHGGRTVDRPGPRHATVHLLKEMFGSTTRYASFVNLSDGGHFDNLGLYEVVLRRCRFILVSDAGCDPKFGFSDLGNAIAKIRIDFGIPIEFEHQIEIRPRDDRRKQTPAAVYCAIAKIKYSVPDGAVAEDGTLVYLKPTLAGRPEGATPYDVQAYAHASSAFPHESTADQWFSERQFESYRALGDHLVRTILGATPLSSLAEFEDCMRRHAARKPPVDEKLPQSGQRSRNEERLTAAPPANMRHLDISDGVEPRRHERDGNSK